MVRSAIVVPAIFKETFSSCRQMILHSHHRSVRPCRFRTADLA
jgi:hypothetical protein